MIVYRVEREKPEWIWKRPIFGNPRQPLAVSDGIKHAGPDERFGFRTLCQFRRWFNKTERKVLRQYEFKLAKYEVPDHHVSIGGKQVVFDIQPAKLLKRVSI